MPGYTRFIILLASNFFSMCVQSTKFSSQSVCISNTDYSDTVVANLTDVASASMCAVHCSFIVECESFLFDTRDHICVLKSLEYSGTLGTCHTNVIYGQKVFLFPLCFFYFNNINNAQVPIDILNV